MARLHAIPFVAGVQEDLRGVNDSFMYKLAILALFCIYALSVGYYLQINREAVLTWEFGPVLDATSEGGNREAVPTGD